jgi:branched-chain amino acid transport system substrate-binding protein
MRMLLSAIEQGKTTEGPGLVKALESVKLQAGSLPIYCRAWDHQLIHPIKALKGQAPVGDQWDMLELLRIVPSTMDELDAMYGTKAEVGCAIGDL